MAEKNVKKRNWTFVAYPDSLPKDWIEQIQKSGVKCAISPLHDQDFNADNERKKPHYHVILVYDGPTTYNSVKSFTNGRLGQTVPQPLEQVRGMYRYFTHEDNPEKAQYSKSDIRTINGFDIREFVELTKSEVAKAKREVVELIRDNGICEYADLIDILMDGGESTADLFDVASSNTLFFKAYLTSQWRRNSTDRVQRLHKLANPESEGAGQGAEGGPPQRSGAERPGADRSERPAPEPGLG